MEDGTEAVDEYVDALSVKRQVIIDLQIDRLNGRPPSAPPPEYPVTSQVRGPLRELRCHCGSELHRILYRRSHNLIVLLHALLKNTDKIPEKDIAIAEERWRDFKARMDAEPRRPPRAAGRDAP